MSGIVTRACGATHRASMYVLKQHMHKGFTLIEVLITIFIIGSLIALVGAMFSFISLTRDTKYEDIALRIATNQLESIRAAGYDNAVASSSLSDTLLTSLPSGSASSTIATFNAKTKQVTVGVAWSKNNQIRTLSISTLLTQTGGL